ncbi:MAG TPA: cupin domain-containing protein [Caulifigura sp.]|jgi:quercetin dioxygenase-like cupin family protein|nr:cupin domain-containing protein [Caulifigura sp.]
MPLRLPSIVPTTAGRCIGVVGDVYRMLATGKETDGKYALIDALVPPGGGPPPHRHSREEEGFYVLDGELTITCDGERQTLSAGMFANLPIGSLHSFKNEGATAVRMLILIAPAGLEEMFLEVGQPLEAGTTTAPPPGHEEIEKLIAVAPRYGVELQLPQ